MIQPASLTARLDRDDRLVSADPPFLSINARAGGDTGVPLAVPPLATIVRLARRLAIPVSRAIGFADGDNDVTCWVRARPDAQGVTLSLSDLRERAPAASQAAPRDVALPPGADWVWETDAQLRVRTVSIGAGAAWGFDAAGALGKPLTRLFALDGGDDGALPILEALAARQDFDGQEAVLRASGRRVRLAAQARSDAGGGFTGFLGGAYMRAAEPPRVEPMLMRRFSERLDAALRAPLGRIVANADSINAAADGPLAPHYVDYAADIANAGRHLMELVDDLADLEAIERPDFSTAADPIDLADVARRAAGLLTVRAADAGVAIERPAPDQEVPVTGEFRRTLQVLVNLVGNAVRYTPRGGTVVIRVEADGARALATVADQGRGIAPTDQARIFDKFERVDPSEPGGSGLGLYIARTLARAMGGDLIVDSAVGAGARFVFSLPVRPDEQRSGARPGR